MCKLRFYLFKAKMYRINGCSPMPDHLVAVRHATDREQQTPSVQSLAAGHDLLPLEEGVGAGKRIDLRRLMVEFNDDELPCDVT